MNIILVNGHVGCLKTTLSYFLAANLKLGLVSTSNLGYFTSDKNDPNFMKFRESRYDKLYLITEEYLKNNVSVVLDGNFPYNKLRSKIFRLAEKYKAKNIISIKCISNNKSIVKRRLAFRKKNNLAPDSDANSIDAYLNSVSKYEEFSNDLINNKKLSRIEFDSGKFSAKMISSGSAYANEVLKIVEALIKQKFLEKPFFIEFEYE